MSPAETPHALRIRLSEACNLFKSISLTTRLLNQAAGTSTQLTATSPRSNPSSFFPTTRQQLPKSAGISRSAGALHLPSIPPPRICCGLSSKAVLQQADVAEMREANVDVDWQAQTRTVGRWTESAVRRAEMGGKGKTGVAGEAGERSGLAIDSRI